MASTPKEPQKLAKAVAVVELEIDVDSTWGEDCTVGQVYKQAEDEARGLLNQAFAAIKATHHVRMRGKPKITAVLTPRDY